MKEKSFASLPVFLVDDEDLGFARLRQPLLHSAGVAADPKWSDDSRELLPALERAASQRGAAGSVHAAHYLGQQAAAGHRPPLSRKCR
jgi:hypothetical protein